MMARSSIQFRVGQQATIRAEAFPENVYTGQVTRIAPEARVEQNVTLFDVLIRVENSDGNLRSGMNTLVEVEVVHAPDALTIPLTALMGEADGNLMYFAVDGDSSLSDGQASVVRGSPWLLRR
jgi:HlyD family secretion protein